MSDQPEWLPCKKPALEDILRWNEPIWAAPSKPRGKPDQAGEQQITAKVMTAGESFEFEVLAVEKLSGDDALLKVKTGDRIRRKRTTISQGACRRRTP